MHYQAFSPKYCLIENIRHLAGLLSDIALILKQQYPRAWLFIPNYLVGYYLLIFWYLAAIESTAAAEYRWE